MKPRWNRKPCGCVKTTLPRAGKVSIRCPRHRGRPAKTRLLAYFDENGLVRAGVRSAAAVSALTHKCPRMMP